MSSHPKAIRAVTAVFFQKTFMPTVIVIAVLLTLLWSAVIYLGSAIHGLWFIFLVPLLPATIVFFAVAAGLWALSKKLLPRKLSREERRVMQRFTDKLFRVAAVKATPVPVLAFMIAKDVARGRKSEYVESTVQDATSLAGDFNAISKLF